MTRKGCSWKGCKGYDNMKYRRIRIREVYVVTSVPGPFFFLIIYSAIIQFN